MRPALETLSRCCVPFPVPCKRAQARPALKEARPSLQGLSPASPQSRLRARLPEVLRVCFPPRMRVCPAARPQPGPSPAPHAAGVSVTSRTCLSPLLHAGPRSCPGSSGSSVGLPSPRPSHAPPLSLGGPLLRPETRAVSAQASSPPQARGC